MKCALSWYILEATLVDVVRSTAYLDIWGPWVFSAHQCDNLNTSLVDIFLLNNTPAITFVLGVVIKFRTCWRADWNGEEGGGEVKSCR
jgi:hypothetical protein